MTTPAPVTAQPGEVRRTPIPGMWYWQRSSGFVYGGPGFATEAACRAAVSVEGRPVYIPGELEQPPADPREKLEWLVVDEHTGLRAAFASEESACFWAEKALREYRVIHRTAYSKEQP